MEPAATHTGARASGVASARAAGSSTLSPISTTLRQVIRDWIRQSDQPHSIPMDLGPWDSLISRASTISSNLALQFSVPWSSVTYEESRAIIVLREEQDAWREEKTKRDQAMQDAQRRAMSVAPTF